MTGFKLNQHVNIALWAKVVGVVSNAPSPCLTLLASRLFGYSVCASPTVYTIIKFINIV